MSRQKGVIKIVKIPLSPGSKPKDLPASFPRMPQLYLELLENKDKVRPDLINKDYIPSLSPLNDRDNTSRREPRENFDRKQNNDNESTDDEDSFVENNIGQESDDSDSNNDENIENDADNIPEDSDDDQDGSLSRKEKHKHKKKQYKERTPSVASKSDSELSNRLKELLKDNDNDSSRDYDSDDKYSKRRDRKRKHKGRKHRYDYKHNDNRHDENDEVDMAPPLSELENRGAFVRRKALRNVMHTTKTEQEEEDEKRLLLFKFESLRKAYPTDSKLIPEHTIHGSLKTIRDSYDETLRRLSLNESTEDYKDYLFYSFAAIEYVFGNWLNFDMDGYTQHQLTRMDKYQRMLIELGEKSYTPEGSRWPVEMRLLGTMIMNAAIFVGAKAFMNSTGVNMLNMMPKRTSMDVTTSNGSTQKKRRSMKPPDIDLEDLPEVDDGDNDGDNDGDKTT